MLSLVLGVGAAVSTICNPVFGAFSDRTTWRMGRRLPWVLIGAAGGSLSLIALSTASSVPAMLIGWCGVQVFLNAMYAAVMAAIPDQVPVERRGLIGGLVAIAQTVGIVGGVAIASLTGSIAAGYLATMVVLLVLTIPYALGSRDLALPAGHRPPPFALGPVPAVVLDLAARAPRLRLGLDHPVPGQPRQLRGHALPALLRHRRPRHPRGRGGRAACSCSPRSTPSTVIATTAVFGHWSDRVGRRKIFVIWSGIVSGVASLVLAIAQNWYAAVAAAIVLGCAFGIYTAVDFALITQVLPAAAERAKDLGVINIANALPQVLAPALAGIILTLVAAGGGSVATYGDGWSVGYGVVYIFSFVCRVLGSVLVTRIRSVP